MRNRFEFSGFTLDRRDFTLRGPDGAPVRLTPKAFDALVFFLERPGDVIDRETLIDFLWPDTVVEENNLRQVIATLRRAIGEGLIRTVPRRGYQFVSDVLVVTPKAHAGSSSSVRLRFLIAASLVTVLSAGLWFLIREPVEPEVEPPLRLAVLPFADTSQDGDLGHIADAVSLELLTTLSLIDRLEVPGSVSSSFLRDADLATIRRALWPDYLLEGDVRSVGDRLRIAVRLIDTENGAQVWSESYDRAIENLFEVQDEIVRETAQALQISLGVGELGTRLGTTRIPEAFFAIAEASRILRERGGRFAPAAVRQAIPHLERAVALDDACSLCWFELYWQSRWLGILASETGDSAPGASERAAEALQRVEALTPNLPELVLSRIETSADAYELATALDRYLSEAVDLEYPPAISNDIEMRYLRFTGRMREAMAAAERARVFDPLNDTAVRFLAAAYSVDGRHRQALELLDDLAAMRGANAGNGGEALVIAMQLGDRAEVERRAAGLRDSAVSITRDLALTIDDPATALARLRAFVASPDRSVFLWPTQLAPWAAYHGDDALALEMYRREATYATGNTISSPIFAGMRRLPGFRNLVRDMGLLSYWRESGHWPDYCRPLGQEDFECF